MSEVPDSTLKILTSEVGNDSPATSATMYKIGGAINYLLDLAVEFVEYTSGVNTFVVPDGVRQIFFMGCGGGGGGGGSGAVGNGAGGGGGAPICSGFIRVNPGDSLVVTVGAGGAGGGVLTHGAAGGTSSIVGPSVNVQMFGGGGGLAASSPVPSGGYSACAPFIGTSGGNGQYGTTSASPGGSSMFGSGGASGGGSGGDGGGGGAAFGPGGAGGGDSTNAQSPPLTAYGAGGGGGDNIGFPNGASGRGGVVRIWYGF